MTTEQKLRITFVAAGVLALSTIASLVALIIKIPKSPGPKNHIESPITASGGSMTFRALGGWTCGSAGTGMTGMNDYCTSQVSTTLANTFYFENLEGDMDAPSMPIPGTVTFFLRGPGGVPTPPSKPLVAPYIYYCTSGSAAEPCPSTNTGFVRVEVHGPNSSLVYSNAIELINGAVHYAVQYFDATCLVHRPATPLPTGPTDAPPSFIPACEHPGYVNWVDGKNYLCRHGGCRVYLNQ